MNIGKSLHVQTRKSSTIDNYLGLAILKQARAKKPKRKNKVTKGNKALMVFTIAWLLIISLQSCAPSEVLPSPENPYPTHQSLYHKSDVCISRIGTHDYVFWHNGYGSDMEHYAGCSCSLWMDTIKY